jgi:uncharacterized protein
MNASAQQGVVRAVNMRGVASLLGLLVAGYMALMGGLWAKQEKLLFQPTVLPAGLQFNLPPDVQEAHIDVPEGRLHALHLQLKQPDGVVFYLHGNGGSLAGWFTNLDLYRSMNVDLFMIDYRGYGKSQGHIESEAQLLADVRAAWDTIAPRYQGKRVIFLGRSLGTGLAARLAESLPSAQRPDLLLLVSPYVSMKQMARELYWFAPSFLLRYPLRTDEALMHMQGGRPRVVLVHGDQDLVVPYRHSEVLKQSVPGLTLEQVPGAGHADIQNHPAYVAAVRRAIESIKMPP